MGGLGGIPVHTPPSNHDLKASVRTLRSRRLVGPKMSVRTLRSRQVCEDLTKQTGRICLGTGSSPLYPYEGMKRNRVEPVASSSFDKPVANLRSHYYTEKGPTVGINSVCGDGFAFIPGTIKTLSQKVDKL